MVGKGAHVKEMSRDSVEAFMRRMLPRSEQGAQKDAQSNAPFADEEER